MLVVLIVGALTSSHAPAATSSSVVGATVLSATDLDISGCTGSDLALGSLPAATTVITPTGCDLTFGSSNDTAALRAYQADQLAPAMTQFAATSISLTGSNDISGIAARDANEAWAVGTSRFPGRPHPLVHTSDGGATWEQQTSCVPTPLTDIDYVTDDTLVAIGSYKVCRTTDAGANWTSVTTPAAVWNSVEIKPSGVGWLAGNAGNIAKTGDGGASWTPMPNPDPAWNIHDLRAASATQLYAAATVYTPIRMALALTSDDGGLNWDPVGVVTSPTAATYGVTVLSTTTALVDTSAGKFRTTDSGATWTLVDAIGGRCTAALSPSVLVSFVSHAAPFRRSTDGGATWSPVAPPFSTNSAIWGCDAPTASSVWYVGPNDVRAWSTDAGLTYTVAPSPYQDMRAIGAWSADEWVSVGNLGHVRHSTDGGTTVTTPASGTTEHLRDIIRIGAATMVAVGDGGAVIRSTDRGATWTVAASGTAANLRAIDRAPSGALVAVGATAVIRSVDGGATWTTLTSPGSGLAGVTIGPTGTIWAAGAAGTVYRSTTGGATWTTQPTGSALQLYAIDTFDGVNLLAVTSTNGSNQSFILRSTDGGATWSSTLAATIATHDVAYLSATTAAIGTNLGYLRSVDGGVTWTFTSGVSNAFGVEALDANTFLLAAQGDVVAVVRPTTSFNDYAAGSTDFSGAASTFGACLETAVGTAPPAWPVAGSGNCTAANLTAWRAIAATRTAPTARIADTTAPGSASVTFRFGAKAGNTQTVGDYAAQVVWEVVAPAL